MCRKEKFEDTIAEAVYRRTMQRRKEKRQTMIYKTQPRKLKIEQHENLGVNSGATKGLAVPAPPVTPVVLLLNDMTIILYIS